MKKVNILLNKIATIVCYKRSSQKVNCLEKKHLIINDKIYKCCSTKLRSKPNVKQLGITNYQYIKNNKLYLQYQIKKYMSEYRYQHTLRVLDTITKIAIYNHFNDKDIWRCQIAGILHDIAKELSISRLKYLVSNKELAIFPSIHCAHGLAGAKIAKQKFKINDLKILDAINNQHFLMNVKKIYPKYFGKFINWIRKNINDWYNCCWKRWGG